jgi:hypothetical protein
VDAARLRLLLLGSLLAVACQSAAPRPPLPLTDETLQQAAASIAATDAAREDFALVEGGFSADLYAWEWEERVEWPYRDPIDRSGSAIHPLDTPYLVRERVLRGPERMQVSWREIEFVQIHRWVFGRAVELGVNGRDEPLALLVGSDAEAEALVDAFDLMRRAARP